MQKRFLIIKYTYTIETKHTCISTINKHINIWPVIYIDCIWEILKNELFRPECYNVSEKKIDILFLNVDRFLGVFKCTIESVVQNIQELT